MRAGLRPRWAGWLSAGLLPLLASLAPGPAGAHAFPERAEPRVGSVVRSAPARVQIWFDGDLEPAFSTVAVADAAGQRVDRNDARVTPQNRRLLEVGLPALGPGVYHVSWRVLSVDGHRTAGDYVFTIKAPD